MILALIFLRLGKAVNSRNDAAHGVGSNPTTDGKLICLDTANLGVRVPRAVGAPTERPLHSVHPLQHH
jgi:hypothetical protein